MTDKIHVWLDDERLPGILPFYKKAPYDGVVWDWVRTVPQAIERIQEFGIDNIGFMALDHDLGLCPACESKVKITNGMRDESAVDGLTRKPHSGSYSSCVHYGDGTKLVEWMRDTNTWPAEKPVVHSFNPDGAKRMRAIIDDHYERPGD